MVVLASFSVSNSWEIWCSGTCCFSMSVISRKYAVAVLVAFNSVISGTYGLVVPVAFNVSNIWEICCSSTCCS